MPGRRNRNPRLEESKVQEALDMLEDAVGFTSEAAMLDALTTIERECGVRAFRQAIARHLTIQAQERL